MYRSICTTSAQKPARECSKQMERVSGEMNSWRRRFRFRIRQGATSSTPPGTRYVIAQPCADRAAGFTQIVVDMSQVGTVSFLVRDKGDYHYEMSEISYNRQPGCPGETYATYDKFPSLFKKN